MESRLKMVEYDRFCPKCRFRNRDEADDPCNGCLYEPVNEDSRIPTKFEEE